MLKEMLRERSHLGQEIFRNRSCSVRRLARQVGEAMLKGGETTPLPPMHPIPNIAMAELPYSLR